jgi:hypothetical protein
LDELAGSTAIEPRFAGHARDRAEGKGARDFSARDRSHRLIILQHHYAGRFRFIEQKAEPFQIVNAQRFYFGVNC